MKLLKCANCGDFFRITADGARCRCRACWARYVTLRKVHFSGPADVWGIRAVDFFSIDDRLSNAFRIGESEWVKRVDQPPELSCA
ncbi:MAG: hypothetical protein GY906_07430 [bacterium]|nr:hypothetical protein [bacterium]